MNEFTIPTQKWMRITAINLLIVALLGVLMRYKIAYYFPLLDQKNILHAHSHFAFSGWVSQSLFILLISYLSGRMQINFFKKYRWLLIANLVTAYGMLISFPLQGYGSISTAFSTLSIFISYAFAYCFWHDLNRIPGRTVTHLWFKAALLFNIISSLGPFSLAYMMSGDWNNPNYFLLALYYFLHFQYNGWFFFACAGLFSAHFIPAQISVKIQKLIFWLFAGACIPAFFLSVLWLPITPIGYAIVVLAALAQFIGGALLVYWIRKKRTYFVEIMGPDSRWIMILACVALCIKLFLQLASTIPSLSTFAFGFRPIVIGYLHLVLLGIITLFILGYSKMNNFIITNRIGNTGIGIFVSGIILNELFLLIQGVSYMSFLSIPMINELLLMAAAVMFLGILFLNFRIQINKPSINNINSKINT